MGGGWGDPWGGVGVGLGGQSGCERRIEVFVKIQKKKFWGGGSGGSVGGVGLGGGGGGQGGCERRIEVFVKIQKKKFGGGSGWGGGSVAEGVTWGGGGGWGWGGG